MTSQIVTYTQIVTPFYLNENVIIWEREGFRQKVSFDLLIFLNYPNNDTYGK